MLSEGTKLGKYEVQSLIGSGGMGEVYSAVDLRLGRSVAIKILRPSADRDFRARFISEARTASLLDHPHICTIFEVDETDSGELFIVMALYEGETLDRVLREGPLEITRALAIAVQIGRGLAAAHEELIVHRDIKPANLMLTRGDTVKILDFGIAALQGDPGQNRETAAYGTPAYMSPEQIRGEAVDQRTDIWSLGAVLHEMVTGERAFAGDKASDVVNSVLHDRPRPASEIRPGIPARIDTIIGKALTRERRQRYEQVESMINDLQGLLSALDTDEVTLRLKAASAKRSIAVLPFQDMSPGKDQQFLCDGLAEEILRVLGRTPDLRVASRTSAFQFRDQALDIRDIGARLDVDAIIEGSVRRVDDRVRVSVQLINVENGYRLWHQRFDRKMHDILALEDEIAELIAEALEVTLTGAPTDSGESGIASPESYELYLQGRRFFHQHRRKALETAIQIFSQAIENDLGNARAYAGLADCHSFLNLYFGEGNDAVEAAEKASARALELAPNLADAHASRGLALFLKRDLETAEIHLKRAIELDPVLYDPRYIYGRVCFSMDRPKDAALHFREACAIVPEAYDSWYLLGMCYRRIGETVKARRADLECIEAVKNRVRSHPDDTRAWTMGASVLAELGEPESASEWVARALAIDADEPIIQYNAACVYAALGRLDDAFASLTEALGNLGISRDWAVNDPDLDPLRDDPRYGSILEKAPPPGDEIV
ncbi:MAG: protein kinase [Acidobacteria bacterium]|nr:protein kinase [Acidobacteriota bacterium]